MTSDIFDLEAFLPFLLNRASETTSTAFSAVYKSRYGMTRGQWRVMANLGCHGNMTATDICQRGHLEKTKVSRAVRILEHKGWLTRESQESDRRYETLSLSNAGRAVFDDLSKIALSYQQSLHDCLGEGDMAQVMALLRRLNEVTATIDSPNL